MLLTVLLTMDYGLFCKKKIVLYLSYASQKASMDTIMYEYI